MKKDLYKEYLDKKRLEDMYEKGVTINNQSKVEKVLLFLYDLLLRIIKALIYLFFIAICSIGATYIANKIGIINWR